MALRQQADDRADELRGPAPPTPDFYRYRWLALASATVDGRFVELRWPDGTTMRAFDLWLFENTVGAAIDPITRESVLDPADLDPAIAVDAASVTGDGALAVRWRPDGTERHYHPGWLHHVAGKRHLPSAWIPAPVMWRSQDLPEPPTHDGRQVLSRRAVLDRWILDLLRYGIARLSGVGTDTDFALALVSPIGAIRDTNFGPIWDVKAVVEPDSTANTNRRLCPHTDLPSREIPPGFQLLHCIANTATGGHSTMSDGLAVVDHLARRHPDHYEALTTLNWVFSNRSPTADHRWSGPIIDLGVDGTPLTLRAFHPVRGFPDMDERDLPRAYAALRCFSRVAADPRFQMRYAFRPGDLVGFDNRRILHGRDAYESSGHRHLRGIYIDHDEVRSYARGIGRGQERGD